MNNFEFGSDPELSTIETNRARNVLFRNRVPDSKSAIFLQINKLSLKIRQFEGQNNELRFQRAELYLSNSHIDNKFPENAYEDLKTIIDDIHSNSKPDHEQTRARVYALIESKYELYQRLLAYEGELNPHQESKRARTSSPFK